ncbi:MAG: Ref family recombination enhancement nuclease [Gammaproteobacteria bacterium]|nr:Ref family recombination enhancement nuclease [Gammaproteobacteria bacterium]
MSDYEKKLAQVNAARQRQIERQKAKLACPEYQQKRLAKQKETQIRTLERKQQRMSDPQYITEQREKQIKASEKQLERLRVKESSPDYKKNKIAKQITQAKIQQDKAATKALANKDIGTLNEKKRKPTSKGMKGRNPTAVEKRIGNKIAEIGCICCLNKNWYTPDMQAQETTKFISLHHVDGRTKEWAHAKVLPLCAYHHDTPAPDNAPDELTPIHRGNKKQWVLLNGSEEALLEQVYDIIQEERPWIDLPE